ncbi:hypothetical protein QN277_009156 [Acacia crassicarpa]|uniref:Uncharacterized protein n=1 Tax=Acacia crassicarpa TaxID=499986 RepID=A0AAE1MDV1_9FABA|nr:hypothetical protein QN277_009156 [Acacia crassicarpa]
MCPLRFILVFFSAVLAGYFAWRMVRSSLDTDVASDKSALEDKSPTRKDFSFKVRCFLVTGRYLWSNLRAVNRGADGGAEELLGLVSSIIVLPNMYNLIFLIFLIFVGHRWL